MNIDSKDVVKRLETLGYNIDDSDLTLIQFAINGTEQYIKKFCNIAEIPVELYSVAVDMSAGTLLKTKSSIGLPVCDNIDFDDGRVNSITEGDVSVSYGYDSDTSSAAKYAALLDSLCNRDAELVTFRRLRW
ncbi:MAG: hypothetical protein Q4D26_07675 [Clostridia bacterium]|nr:hypothetical protein [Clostridia bacterium]